MNVFKPLLLAHHCAEDHPSHIAAELFANSVAARTHGQVQISIYPKGALGELPELLQLVIDGRVDMSFPPHDRYVEHCKKFGCVSMPFVFDDCDHADRVLDGEFMDWVTPDLQQQGLEPLSCWEWGFRQFTNSKHPILKPEDMHGLRIRVPPIQTYKTAILALGGKIALVEYSQLAKAMKLGVADGQENPVSVIHARKLYETQKFLSLVNYSYGSMVYIINKKSFDSLTQEQQHILREESKKAGQLMRKLMRAQEQQQLQELAELGVKISTPDLAPFKAAMAPAYEKLKAVFGTENVSTFLEIVERNRARA
ncbi:MAG: TRAP transporter substrate-binding protein [Formivibrio sp.]|nr:TRAP transporter substrate-binding protein [Formivibrio sp.]